MIRKITIHTYASNIFLIQSKKRSYTLSFHNTICIPQVSNYQLMDIYVKNHDHGYLTGRLKHNLMAKILLTHKSASCIYHDKTSNIIIIPIITRNEYDNSIHIILSLRYRKNMCLTF